MSTHQSAEDFALVAPALCFQSVGVLPDVPQNHLSVYTASRDDIRVRRAKLERVDVVWSLEQQLLTRRHFI